MQGDNGGHGGYTRRDLLRGIGALTTTAVAGSTIGGSATAQTGNGAVYQYYHTDWVTIRETLSTVAAAGYDAIQVPPAQSSRLYAYEREFDEETYDVPLGYQPLDLREFDSVFGTEAEYEAMVEEAHEQGLDVIADAVMNHMAAGGDYFDRQVSLGDIPQFDEDHFHEECEIDYDDPDSVEDCWLVGLRDLRQELHYVRQQLYEYLQKYEELGVDGVRFDAAKHMPEWFFAKFANRWADEFGFYSVGEVLDGSTSVNRGYAETGMSVTDFSLYFTMKEDVFDADGDMRALRTAGFVDRDPTRALTFVSNHDEGPPEYERLAYAYVLTYEGYPRVYNHRIDPDDEEISRLLSVRNRLLYGSAAERYVDADLYAFERGDALVVLNRGSSRRTQRVETDFDANTTLTDVTDTAADVRVDSVGSVEVTVPAVGYAVYATDPLDDDGEDDDGEDDDGEDDDDTTSVTLRVEAPTGEDESVYFTGGIEELTEWGGGVEGTESDGVWEVTIQTEEESFEWKTRRGPAGESGDVWERDPTHASDERFPTHNGWEDGYDGGDADTEVTLRVEAPTREDESVYFTGGIEELTGWGGGVEGTESDGVWEVTVQTEDSFEWKTRRGPAGGSGEVWERGANHTSDDLSPAHQGWEDGYDGGPDLTPVEDGRTYVVRNKQSGLALDVQAVATENGANIHVWDYEEGHQPQWIVESTGAGYYRLLATHSGKVVDVELGSTADGANVHQWAYVGSENQQWTFEEREDGYLLRARHSDKVLAATGTDNGANVEQQTDAGGDHQRWTLEKL